ncbi:RILP-like protein 1 isoform X1 [Phycodurus eques]|uniref:RILP-like protein 1 isoform X1 n=1 Tax=Phycodurus eques TaxID=693459 RepID=UPI002ACD32FE|nr:RILP-like protein 1 isoform X1 [Phycodurus eques]
MSALERPWSELTVLDVYDIAAALAQEFERTIERFGCEALAGVVPKVVRVLELLETLVGREGGHEADELRRELLRLRQERSDRTAQEKKHHQELEEVEEVWRAEVDELLSQVARLQAENKKLLANRSLSQAPVADQDPHQQEEETPEKEKHVMTRLNKLLEKLRDEIRAKDHELTLKNDDIEALQMQQHRLIRINQDLRHRLGTTEAHGKAAMRRRAELEAAAQARRRETDALRHELRCLRKERQEWELEREVAKMEESFPSMSRSKVSPQASNCVKADSVWVECGGDPDYLENIPNFLCNSANGDVNISQQDTDKSAFVLEEAESDAPQFTLQELRHVLQERNQLKAQVFLLEDELAYFKSEDFEEDVSCLLGTSSSCPSPPPSCNASSDQPESGIRRLIFTAIMPMVAAGLIGDDPTLLPIRRLVSSV